MVLRLKALFLTYLGHNPARAIALHSVLYSLQILDNTVCSPIIHHSAQWHTLGK